ncbi:uncharacterized protein [Oscarella lobularis]|uniref:uncharacterized protein n=1 Tax=Oscarella lobularis TaxID=121494 RepID=UPI003313E01E
MEIDACETESALMPTRNVGSNTDKTPKSSRKRRSSTPCPESGRTPSTGLETTPKSVSMRSNDSTPSRVPHACKRKALHFESPKAPISIASGLTERQQLSLLLEMTANEKNQTANRRSERSSSRIKIGGKRTNWRIHKRNERGETPLHVACIRGDSDAVQKLIEQGAQINCGDHAGWTPLHEAANHGHGEIVRILLENGADPNALGMDDITPLQDAITNGHNEVVTILIEIGDADSRIQNAAGQNAIDLAKEMNQTDLVQRLLQKESHRQKNSISDGSDLCCTPLDHEELKTREESPREENSKEIILAEDDSPLIDAEHLKGFVLGEILGHRRDEGEEESPVALLPEVEQIEPLSSPLSSPKKTSTNPNYSPTLVPKKRLVQQWTGKRFDDWVEKIADEWDFSEALFLTKNYTLVNPNESCNETQSELKRLLTKHKTEKEKLILAFEMRLFRALWDTSPLQPSGGVAFCDTMKPRVPTESPTIYPPRESLLKDTRDKYNQAAECLRLRQQAELDTFEALGKLYGNSQNLEQAFIEPFLIKTSSYKQ